MTLAICVAPTKLLPFTGPSSPVAKAEALQRMTKDHHCNNSTKRVKETEVWDYAITPEFRY